MEADLSHRWDFTFCLHSRTEHWRLPTSRLDRTQMTKRKTNNQPRVVEGESRVVSVQGPVPVATAAVVRSPPRTVQTRKPPVQQAPKCPLCATRAGTTKISLGPVTVSVCDPCSQPLYHAAGIFSWFSRR